MSLFMVPYCTNNDSALGFYFNLCSLNVKFSNQLSFLIAC